MLWASTIDSASHVSYDLLVVYGSTLKDVNTALSIYFQ